MATVEVYLENRVDGSDVRIPGLGVFKNNTTTTIDEQVWRRYKAAHPDEEYSDSHTFKFGTKDHASTPSPKPVASTPLAKTEKETE